MLKIKEKQDQDKLELQDKEELIAELREVNQDIIRQNELKTEEIRIVIEKLEQYKRGKDGEIQKLRKQLGQAENDIKMLINEQER